MRCIHGACIADPVEDRGVVAGGAEALDDGGEDDGHERLRHAVGHRRHRADRRKRGVGAVGVPEYAKERHQVPPRPSFVVVVSASSSPPPSLAPPAMNEP